MTDTLLCNNHPTRAARRRCYQCGKPICKSCQRREQGHIFCSVACSEAQQAAARAATLRALTTQPLKGRHWRIIAWLLGGVIAAAALWAAWVLPLRFSPLPVRETGKVTATAQRKPPDLRSGAEIAIEEPAKTATVMAPVITLKGRAPPGTMVGIYVENEPAQAIFCRDGQWEIENVPLADRVNLLQARYFDTAGRSGFSPALKILYAGGKLDRAALAPAAAPLEGGLYDLNRGPKDLKRIMLTFDGGAEDREAVHIFETLRQFKIRATIFLTGGFIEKYPELVKQALADGHEIGNHSFSHPRLTTLAFNGRQSTLRGINREFLVDELARTEAAYTKLTGKKLSPYWRAPFGEHNQEIRRWGYEAGYTHVGWSSGLDTLDWVADVNSKLYKDPETIRKNLLARDGAGGGLNGGIILMHLGTERHADQAVPLMLPELIRELREKGYEFVTASDMLLSAEAGVGRR